MPYQRQSYAFLCHTAFWIIVSLPIGSWITGCHSEETVALPAPEPIPSPPKIQGMRPAWPAGRGMTLGSYESGAKKNEEQPRMPISFSYHFSLDSCEVTRGEWDSLMGETIAAGSASTSDSFLTDSQLPKTDISWFDAVLFCNARSKKWNLDTVYTYTDIRRDIKGHAYALTDLAIHWDRMGMRLPTEAEWEWCASAGGQLLSMPSATKAEGQAWFAGNSHGTLHRVGTKQVNAWGYSDLFGNAMEWTQDWMGPYREHALVNFVGAAQPNRLGEKVIKGGGYLTGWTQLRASARSTTYPMTAGTSAAYLGFRCALGRIPGANYLSASGEALAPLSPVHWIDSQLMTLAKATLARVALVRLSGSHRYLQVLEMSGAQLRHFETQRFSSVYAPMLSPDGNWVAFSEGFEGMTGKSQVHILDSHLSKTTVTLTLPTAYIPRWRVDASSLDTFLVFSSSGMDNTKEGFPSQACYQIRMVGGQPIGEPIPIAFGAYHDGLSADGEWLVTGYRHLRTWNTRTQQGKTLFTSVQNGKPQEDTSQVCNVSMRPGPASPRLLFLDFGSSQPSTRVGRAYGVHEVAFMTDIVGNHQGHFVVPEGVASFDDLEWSTDTNYAVAVLQSDANPFSSIGVLDVRTGDLYPILQGDGLSQPHLWLTQDSTIKDASIDVTENQDSLANYSEPFLSATQKEFAAKIVTLIKQKDSAEIVFVGSSQSRCGINPNQIHTGRALNLAVSSAGMALALDIIRHYVLGKTPRLKVVVMEVLLGLLPYPGGDGSLANWISPSKGYQYDLSHGFWKNGFPTEMIQHAQNSKIPSEAGMDALGYFSIPANPWSMDSLPQAGRFDFTADDPIVQANLQLLREFVLEMKAYGIAVLLLQTPEYPRFATGNYVTMYGPSKVEAEMLHTHIKTLCDDHPRCAFYDAHQNGHNDYVEYDFYDWNHLSDQGASRFTPRVDSVLAELLAR